MGITHATKQKLFHEIEHLSNSYLVELQGFIQYLQFKQSSIGRRLDNIRLLPPEHDPILQAIGVVDVTPFSETIDEILYEDTIH